MGNRTIRSFRLRRDRLESARLACRPGLGAALGIGTFLLGMGAAHAESINACPVTITKPGTYNLNKDLVCNTNGAAITISTDNVILNLKGHILLGPQSGASTSFGVYVGARQNVIVQNGTITGFYWAVLLQGSTFSRITGITARGNADSALVNQSGHNNAISGCDAFHNGQAGIRSGSTLATITNNTANNNVASGIFDFGTLSTIQGNTASSNGKMGIYLFFGTQATVQGNTVEFNVTGIDAYASTGNTITGNTALGNYFRDLEDDNANCDSNTWLNNTFVTSNQSCIH